MRTEFSNHFGRAVLTPVTPVMAVSAISAASCPEAMAHRIDLNIAEQLALISENRGIQVCFASFDVVYVIAHESPSTAAICAVTITDFRCEFNTAADQLAAAATRMTFSHLSFV